MNCHYIGPVIWKAFPCYDINLRDGNLPLSFHSLLSGDLYTSLNWVAFRLGNGLGLVWWWGQQIYLDQFCWWLLQYARATTILLFVQQLVRAYNKENIKAMPSCPFVRGINVLPGIPIRVPHCHHFIKHHVEALISVTHCGPVTLHGNISAFFRACYGCQWIPSHYVNHIKFNVFETTWKTFP